MNERRTVYVTTFTKFVTKMTLVMKETTVSAQTPTDQLIKAPTTHKKYNTPSFSIEVMMPCFFNARSSLRCTALATVRTKMIVGKTSCPIQSAAKPDANEKIRVAD